MCNPSSGTRPWELAVLNLSSLWYIYIDFNWKKKKLNKAAEDGNFVLPNISAKIIIFYYLIPEHSRIYSAGLSTWPPWHRNTPASRTAVLLTVPAWQGIRSFVLSIQQVFYLTRFTIQVSSPVLSLFFIGLLDSISHVCGNISNMLL